MEGGKLDEGIETCTRDGGSDSGLEEVGANVRGSGLFIGSELESGGGADVELTV